MTDIVQRAKALAHRTHAGQVDKAGRPYIEHVARVAAAVSDDPEAEAVAWLHDVLEDCDTDDMYNAVSTFQEDVFWSVWHLSRSHFVDSDSYYATVKTDPIALRVKLADIADNADPARLALLDEPTRERLKRKYAKALAALTEAA